MKNEIKSRLEIVPLLLVIESMVCFILSYFKFYSKIFTHWEELTECSFLMCFIFYGLSKDWGFVAKKAIATLFLLNTINFIFGLMPKDYQKTFYLMGLQFDYYNSFTTAIFIFFTILTTYELCKKQ